VFYFICFRKKRKKNAFILDEAEDAFDTEECFNSDYESSQVDADLQDFVVDDYDIDDIPDTAVHANYMKSVSSQRFGVNNKFKLQYNFDPNIDVYSQAVIPEDDEYEMDSFCCDEIVYAGATQPVDKSKFESPNLKLRSKKAIRRTVSTPITSTPKTKAKRRFKRVRIESP